MKIERRTFIISGGSSGLGLATAQILLSHNANVSLLDLNPPPPSASPLLSDSSRTHFTATDVSSSSSLQAALSSAFSWIESTRTPLGGLICCAGIGTPGLALPRQTDPNNPAPMPMTPFDRVIAINLRGTVDLIRLVAPHMAINEPEGSDGERGVIVVVSSIAAYEGQVGQLAYSASKGAVASMVLPLARELGQKAGIRVMGIAPGLFETGMTSKPKTKVGSPSNGAATAPTPTEKPEPTTSSLVIPKLVGPRASMNPNMVEYPVRMGRSDEFARMVKEIVENSMLNGGVIRLDGGVRFPSRL